MRKLLVSLFASFLIGPVASVFAQGPTPPPPPPCPQGPCWTPLASGYLEAGVYWSQSTGDYRYGITSYDPNTGAQVYTTVFGGRNSVQQGTSGFYWSGSGTWFTAPSNRYAVGFTSCKMNGFGIQYCGGYTTYRNNTWRPPQVGR